VVLIPVLRYHLFGWVVVLALLAQQVAVAQQADDSDYDREFNYGINFNTAGGYIGGGFLKYAVQSKDDRFYTRYQLEIVNIKHPKEKRVAGNNNGSSSYAFAKTNFLFVVRPSYGKEMVLFRKAPEEGVQLNGHISIGPSIGVQKPYYVLYDLKDQFGIVNTLNVPYNPETVDNRNIQGAGRFLSGFDALKFTPGAHFRAGLSFEFGTFKSSVAGIDIGFVSEIFAKPMEMLSVPNQTGGGVKTNFKPIQTVNALYLTLYYGNKF